MSEPMGERIYKEFFSVTLPNKNLSAPEHPYVELRSAQTAFDILTKGNPKAVQNKNPLCVCCEKHEDGTCPHGDTRPLVCHSYKLDERDIPATERRIMSALGVDT